MTVQIDVFGCNKATKKCKKKLTHYTLTNERVASETNIIHRLHTIQSVVHRAKPKAKAKAKAINVFLVETDTSKHGHKIKFFSYTYAIYCVPCPTREFRFRHGIARNEPKRRSNTRHIEKKIFIFIINEI